MSPKSLLFAASISMLWVGIANAANVEVGTLDCDVAAGIGAIVGSKQDAQCTFTPSQSGPADHYSATITNFGLDIGTIQKARLIWLVYAPTTKDYGKLDGAYRGAEANASLGIGVGANVLIGNGKTTFVLQPVSVEAEQGVNIAVGVTEFRLRLQP